MLLSWRLKSAFLETKKCKGNANFPKYYVSSNLAIIGECNKSCEYGRYAMSFETPSEYIFLE